MFKYITFSSFIVLLMACAAKKKIVAPVEVEKSVYKVGIVDTFVPSVIPYSSQLGLDFRRFFMNEEELEKNITKLHPDWILTSPKKGLINLFRSEITYSSHTDSYAIDDIIDGNTLKSLLTKYNCKVALFIDPKVDNIEDVAYAARQIRDYNIPFSHWQFGELPYLEPDTAVAPLWIDGQDYATKANLYFDAIKNIDATQKVYLAAGNTSYNLFTDEVLTYGHYSNPASIMLYWTQFLPTSSPKSNYINSNNLEGSFMANMVVSDSILKNDLAFSNFFSSLLSTLVYNVTTPICIVTPEHDQNVDLFLGALAKFNFLAKSCRSIQPLYINESRKKQSGIEPIALLKDARGNRSIIVVNNSNKQITVDLSLEFDSITTLDNLSFLYSGKTESSTSSNAILLPPNSINFITTSAFSSDQSDQSLDPKIEFIDLENLKINWSTSENFTKYIIQFGQNKANLENKYETAATDFTFSNLRLGRTYFYTIEGLNDQNSKSLITADNFLVAPPSTPEKPKLTKVGKKLMITWPNVKNNQEYTIQVFNRGSIKEVNCGKSNSLSLDSLASYDQYRISVKAANIFGESEYSPISFPSFKGELPQAPSNLRKEGNRYFWSPSLDSNSVIWYKIYKGNELTSLVEEPSEILDTTFYDFSTGGQIKYTAVKSVNQYGSSSHYSNLLTLADSAEINKVNIFDVYSNPDSTTIVVKFNLSLSDQKPDEATLILQNKLSKYWEEERFDCSANLVPLSNQYKIKFSTKEFTKYSTWTMIAKIRSKDKYYLSRPYILK